MSTSQETLSSYIPPPLVRRFAADPRPLSGPELERFPAAVFFADISGFTPLAERLAQHGPVGAEELAHLLNAYFGQLIALVAAHGGEVVKFAGDALLALWPAMDEPLAIVTRRAAQCGLAAQERLNDYEVTNGLRLSMRIGISAGEVLALHVGGVVEGRWYFLIAGAPLGQMSAAEQQARPGEIVLSPEAWVLVQDACVGKAPAGGYVRLEAIGTPLSLRAAALQSPAPEADVMLRAYLPDAILTRLAAGHAEWLAELRRVTALFLNLLDVDYTSSGMLEQTQAVMEVVQPILHRYEGGLTELIVDDKGTMLVIAFGLPPLVHEDDAVRGVQTAVAMQAALQQLGVRSAIGITTGQAFCGSVGSVLRREYTVIGDVMNLAARLMQAAPDTIRCDAATYQAAQAHLTFDALPTLRVKGKAHPVAVYRPRGQARRVNRLGAMIGRVAERANLTERLQALQGGTSGLVIIEGEAGIGKSRLVADLLGQAQAFGARSLVGAGDAIEGSTPYHAWRSVFGQLFNLETYGDPEERRAHVLNQLQSNPELVRLAPLLNSVLALDLPENEITALMTGEVRANNTQELLVRVLQTAMTAGGRQAQPLLLILEDAQWLDSASWALTGRVSTRVQPLLLVIVTRPMEESLPADYQQLRDASDTQRVRLAGLAPADTRALVCERLGVHTLPEQVVALIHERAEGNPFFTEELAYALRDAGLIVITEGVGQLASGAGDLSALTFPDTVQGVIAGRIDRLPSAHQLTLKVASVIGRVFAFRILRDIYPIEADKAPLADYLNTLQRLDFTLLDTPEPDLAYLFKHLITQEVAYNLMLFAQRRQLHRATAEWYEHTYSDDLSPFYSLLAHHWSKAVESPRLDVVLTSKTIEYFAKAGEHALRGGAYREAVGFFRETLRWTAEIDENGGEVTPPTAPTRISASQLQRARWERQLGDASVGSGDLTEGRTHLERALALLGRPVPTTPARLVLSLLRQNLQQTLHRLWPARFLGRSQQVREVLLEAVRAYERLTELYFFVNDTLRTLHGAVQGLNLAEAAGPSPELARISGNMCVTAGLMSMHGLARIYSRQALETAHRVGQPAALAWASMATSLRHIGIGQWKESQETIEQAIELWGRLGDRRYWEASSVVQSMLIAYRDGDFIRSANISANIYASGLRSGNAQAQSWGLLGQAENALRLGQLDEAFTHLEAAEALIAKNIGRTEEIRIYGLLALAHLRRGQPSQAQQAAEKATQLITQSSPTTYYSLEGYAAVAEVYLTLWGASQQSVSNRKQAMRLAHQACSALRKFARVFPIAQPRALLWQGLQDWLKGASSKAHKKWQRSLAAAERLAMPYEQGLAHYEIGRHTTGETKQHHLVRAHEIFSRLGAPHVLAPTQDILQAVV